MRAAVAIGTFDGIHCGHRHLLGTLLRRARREKLRAVAVIMERPVRPVAGLLTTLDEKLRLLCELPLDEVVVLPTTPDIIDQPAGLFFDNIIVGKLRAKRLVVGQDFAFGYGRAGNVRWLLKMGRRKGVGVTIVRPLQIDHDIISSSCIRALIQEGDIDRANRLLGRYYSFTGIPERGRAVGREIGFPTINLTPDPEKLLPPGVFAALVDGKKSLLPAVMNIGVRPTFFDEGKMTVEINLLDFKGEWTDEPTSVYVCRRLRGEMRFPGVDELKRQLEKDVRDAAAYFGVNRQ